MHSGAKLCEIARGEDPWLNAENGEVISHESILKYYASLDPDKAPKTSTWEKQRKKCQKKANASPLTSLALRCPVSFSRHSWVL
jgi:hypothetical protein